MFLLDRGRSPAFAVAPLSSAHYRNSPAFENNNIVSADEYS
jgi:hypothetical protein